MSTVKTRKRKKHNYISSTEDTIQKLIENDIKKIKN